MPDCIFCKIARHEVATDFVFEDDEVMAFADIHPKTPVHLLIVPKKHIQSVAQLEERDASVMAQLTMVAKRVAEEHSLPGYRLQIAVGRAGGQTVDHLHMHLMGGTPFQE